MGRRWIARLIQESVANTRCRQRLDDDHSPPTDSLYSNLSVGRRARPDLCRPYGCSDIISTPP